MDICPACLTAYERLMSIEEKQTESQYASFWSTAEEKVDEKVYSFLKDFQMIPSEVGKKHTHRSFHDLWTGLLWILNALFRPRRIIMVGFVSMVVFCCTYGIAYISRPAYFKLAELDKLIEAGMRSAGSNSNDFSAGMDLFYNKQYRKAIERLEPYINENPNDLAALHFIGLSYLFDAKIRWLGLGYAFNGEKVEKAISYFEKSLPLCRKNRFYEEDCRWYLGKAYLMQGKPTKAYDQFQAIVRMNYPDLMRKKESEHMIQHLEKII